MDEMIEVAKAAELQLIVSISPDKASIYPENLDPWARTYWSCKLRNNLIWRRALSRHPAIIDHAVSLLAAKQRNPKEKLYFLTDTHWTPLAASWALRQLISAIGMENVKLPDPVVTNEKRSRPTDMGSLMLLLPIAETYDNLDWMVEGQLSRLAGVPERKTVIIHDSFYEQMLGPLASNFPGASYGLLEVDDQRFATTIAEADRVIVNSIERSFIYHALRGTLAWSSPLGQAILKRRQLAAANKVYTKP
jgi:hypothetical protein